MINIEDFSKVEIKIGTVLEAEKVPDADRLIKLIFDFGSAEQNSSGEGQVEGTTILPELAEKYPLRHVRQVMSAIAPYIPDPSVLVGRQIAVVTNLIPRKFRGYESQGMIMATDDEGGIVLLTPERKVEPGKKVH
jgi:methionyl-tRNA synthetase